MPMSGVKDRPCLVVESPERTEDRGGTTSPVPMSGTKHHQSLMDDSPAVPKVNNPCWGGRKSGGGRLSNPPNGIGVSPLNYTSYGGPPTAVLPNFLGGIQRLPVFASHPRIQSPMEVHESPQYIVVDELPPPPPQPNAVGPVSPPLSPLTAYVEHVHGIPYFVQRARDGGSGGGAFL